MSIKPRLLLAAVALCCIITSSAMGITGRRHRCICLQTTKRLIPLRDIKKIEVTPPGGNCRQVEIIVTRNNGSPVCIDPESPLLNLIRRMQEQQR
uniref:Chemokine interleukin-8-like domain-containing protein n=1 Tax=Myripristis murdjan TaxID=586833 RepID=A0A667YC44_9TELE